MKSKMKNWFLDSRAQNAHLTVFLLAAWLLAPLARAQTLSRFVGTITAVSGNRLTVKTDQGQAYEFGVTETAALKRIEPGQRDLSTAQAIQFSDLAVGDRALVRLDPNAPPGTLVALQIVAIKQADVAQKQELEREDWQQRGVGGLVKSVDPATGVIVLTSGAGPLTKTITVHVTQTTMLKRYALGSVRFDEAQTAPIEAIHPGDQLRARGAKNEAGTEIGAEEVVSGSFRNISGLITSIDPAASTLTVKDLATKKPVTIHIPADVQMRQLPDRMATLLAALLQAKIPGGGQSHQGQWSGGAQAATGGGRPWGGAGGQGGPGSHPGRGGNLQRVLDRAPAIQISDLKKDEAVMVVSTEGKTEVTAITLLTGVEPLLESPEASRDLLSSWSMNSGAGTSDDTQ